MFKQQSTNRGHHNPASLFTSSLWRFVLCRATFDESPLVFITPPPLRWCTEAQKVLCASSLIECDGDASPSLQNQESAALCFAACDAFQLRLSLYLKSTTSASEGNRRVVGPWTRRPSCASCGVPTLARGGFPLCCNLSD